VENDTTFTLITHDDDGTLQEKTVSIKAKTSWDKTFDECEHNQVLVDESLWAIECRNCGEKLDPIKFLLKLARKESMEESRIQKLRREYKRITDILAIKTNTRCKHCGKITPVNTEADIKKIGLLFRYVDTKKNQELNEMPGHRCGESDEGTIRWEHEFYLLRETPKVKIYVCKFCGKTVTEEKGEIK
jgi:ribosomal protein S27E